jgi:hypothetical protein
MRNICNTQMHSESDYVKAGGTHSNHWISKALPYFVR